MLMLSSKHVGYVHTPERLTFLATRKTRSLRKIAKVTSPAVKNEALEPRKLRHVCLIELETKEVLKYASPQLQKVRRDHKIGYRHVLKDKNN